MAKRLNELDSIRGLAALTVVLNHCMMVVPISPSGYIGDVWFGINHSPFRIYDAGHQAVLTFFVLSGLVLGMSLESGRQTYLSFLVRRIFRLWLPYVGSVVLAMILLKAFSHYGISGLTREFNETWSSPISAVQFIEFLVLVGPVNYVILNPVIWSLVFEMRISLIFPFVNSLAHRAPLSVWILAGLAISAASNLMQGKVFGAFDTFYYLIAFMVGMLLSARREYLSLWLGKRRTSMRWLLFIAGATFYSLFFYFPSQAQASRWIVWIGDLGAIAGAVVFISLAITSDLGGARFLGWSPIRHLGKISYSLYLLHVPVLFSLIYLLYGHLPYVLIAAIAVIAALGLATLYSRYVEYPANRLGRSIASRMEDRAGRVPTAISPGTTSSDATVG